MTGIPPLTIGRAQARKPSVKLPKALSIGEETFLLHMKARGLKPLREHKFCPDRNFRADFAFPEHGILIEIDGGAYTQGRHTRGRGFAEDCAKLNAAVMLGWRVLRYTTEMVTSGLADRQVAELLGVP